jgi:hypothetical protein
MRCRSRDVVGGDAKTRAKLLENVRWQSFGHHVGQLLASWNMEHADVAKCHALADEVDVQLHILGQGKK